MIQLGRGPHLIEMSGAHFLAVESRPLLACSSNGGLQLMLKPSNGDPLLFDDIRLSVEPGMVYWNVLEGGTTKTKEETRALFSRLGFGRKMLDELSAHAGRGARNKGPVLLAQSKLYCGIVVEDDNPRLIFFTFDRKGRQFLVDGRAIFPPEAATGEAGWSWWSGEFDGWFSPEQADIPAQIRPTPTVSDLKQIFARLSYDPKLIDTFIEAFQHRCAAPAAQ